MRSYSYPVRVWRVRRLGIIGRIVTLLFGLRPPMESMKLYLDRNPRLPLPPEPVRKISRAQVRTRFSRTA